jgi:glycosyltransferase involved in cell wall biosynthesis
VNTLPKLLIVTPTLGASPFLADTVAAVRGITGVDLQYLLVCPQAQIERLQREYPDCAIVADQGRAGGIYGAINAGLAAARPGWEWFTYINDDDLLTPEFSRLLERHCRPENLRSVAYGDIDTFDEAGESLGRMTVETNPAYFPALLQQGISPTGQQGMLFGAPVVQALGGYDLKYRICADLEFWARACAQGFAFRHYPLEVGRFRIRAGQISGDVSLLREQVDEVARVHFPKPVSAAAKHFVRLRYRVCNLPRYLGRLRHVGLARSLDVLQTGGRSPAKKKSPQVTTLVK